MSQMSLRTPFLVRRKDTLYFRVAVPVASRAKIGQREIVRSLRTSNRDAASTLALLMAAEAKALFALTRDESDEMDPARLKRVVDEKLRALERAELREGHEQELAEQAARHRQNLRKIAEKVQALRQADKSAHDVEVAALAARVRTLEEVLARNATAFVSAPTPATPTPRGPRLGAVVDEFLKRFDPKKRPMLSKHRAVLPALVEVLGDPHVSSIRQSDLTRFFDVVLALPPRWSDIKRRDGSTIAAIAKSNTGTGVNKKTFESTYLASVRPFLEWAITHFGDAGFPRTLTTRAIEYRGDRTGGERKQRALRQDELKRLFEGTEMMALAADQAHQQKYWLPHVALFTGARVNELCQMNPQTDIVEREGAWCFLITEDSEGDERIRKSVKNAVSKRTVPIHSTLLALGFLSYAKAVQASGAKLLFPGFKPSRGKASAQAEKWFSGFLRELGLRDETPGACVLGMHAFRSTFMNFGSNLGLNVEPITGHAEEGKSAVVRGYVGEQWLAKKVVTMSKMDFGIKFVPPVEPSRTNVSSEPNVPARRALARSRR